MGLRIRTNISSVNAQRRLEMSSNDMKDSMTKLASGERINKAADDAAGLAISENMRADIRSLNQARRNANDGISLVQTAEGGLMETTNMLSRLRELAIQSASDTIGNTERGFVNKEFVALKDEIDRIAASTEFNGTRLLTGAIDMPEDTMRGGNNFPLEIHVGKDYYGKSDALDSANPINIIKVDLSQFNATSGGENGLGLGTSAEGTSVGTKVDAQMSISTLDKAIEKVNDFRSYLGAIQNRLTVSSSNLGTQVENISEARSRIRDTDFASETAKMTQAKIMQQAGTSILSNANQQPQVALELLRNL